MTHATARHRAAAALAATLAAVWTLAGCGGGSTTDASGETTATRASAKLVAAGLVQPEGCFLTVFLSESHTDAQKLHVQSLLLGNRAIRRVSYVPRALALRRLARIQPAVAKGMHVNPFPDSFEVVPATRGAVFAIVTDFAAGVDGVTNVKAATACPSA